VGRRPNPTIGCRWGVGHRCGRNDTSRSTCRLERHLRPAASGADVASPINPAGGGGWRRSPLLRLRGERSLSHTAERTSTAKPATVLAVVVIALTTVYIVSPTSPDNTVAKNGIKASIARKLLAVRARSIIWARTTKAVQNRLLRGRRLCLRDSPRT